MALCTELILQALLPHSPFILYTNASTVGIEVILKQQTLQGEQPIFYLSHKLTHPKQNYTVKEKEALAIRWAVEEFKYYLWGRPFIIVTDHALFQ